MRLILTFLVIVISSSILKIQAQNSGFAFSLGPSINVLFGEGFENTGYSDGRMSYQFNGYVGYVSNRGENKSGNLLGIFGTAGTLYPEMIAIIQSGGAQMLAPINLDKKFNGFYNIEAGMIIGQIMRLSGGVGKQTYTYFINQKGAIDYYSGTVGLFFNLGIVNWVVECNIATGGDLTNEVIKVSTGFMVKF